MYSFCFFDISICLFSLLLFCYQDSFAQIVEQGLKNILQIRIINFWKWIWWAGQIQILVIHSLDWLKFISGDDITSVTLQMPYKFTNNSKSGYMKICLKLGRSMLNVMKKIETAVAGARAYFTLYNLLGICVKTL